MKLKIATNKSAGSTFLKDAASVFTHESRFFILYRQRRFSLAKIYAEESPFSESSYYTARRIITNYNNYRGGGGFIIIAEEEEEEEEEEEDQD
jgi:hypothetical protein